MEPLIVARGKSDLVILPQMANRHGLVAGATGTGKTVSLRVLAENFSRIGVPVFMADVKGDLSGIAEAGGDQPKVAERIKQLGLKDFAFAGCPVTFWDLLGQEGHPMRATVSEVGPLLLSRMLDLNDVQEGVLTLVFRIADDSGLLLLDLKDLRAILQYAAENADQFQTAYGNIASASVGAIQRNLLSLEQQGGDKFFGEPALNLQDFLQTDGKGCGRVNILSAEKLMQSPQAYATLLLWLLSELFEHLPEVGDLEKPKLLFFFDEAHLLFNEAPKALLQKIEQVVRLIRSKGVGIFFITQNPLDIPDVVLGQLGNRIQHGLHAFTPREQKAVRAAAETFRADPKLDVEKAINELAVGEALVSFLNEKGEPAVVQRALIYPPRSRLAPLTADCRGEIIRQSLIYGHYEKEIDRESAYEVLMARAGKAADKPPDKAVIFDHKDYPRYPGTQTSDHPARRSDSLLQVMAKSMVRAVGSSIGRQIVRGILGGLLGGRR